MGNASFALKKPPTSNKLFMPSNAQDNNVTNITADKLHHYHNHPFKLYEGERQQDMVESILANGIITPLIVRPLPSGDYEILAGHNRFESGKLADLVEFPCIIKTDLTDEEAHIIVTETNLMQRSFADLSHSERAVALSVHYNAIKHQGKRTDIIRQIEELLGNESADNLIKQEKAQTGVVSIEVTGDKYGLSKNSVARYLRINNLVSGFKELLDTDELSIRAGVSLSYIDEDTQMSILEQVKRYEVTISMKQAEQLRKLSLDKTISNDDFILSCADILIGRIDATVPTPPKIVQFKLERSAISSYFKDDDTPETMQNTVLEALAFYHQHHNKN